MIRTLNCTEKWAVSGRQWMHEKHAIKKMRSVVVKIVVWYVQFDTDIPRHQHHCHSYSSTHVVVGGWKIPRFDGARPIWPNASYSIHIYFYRSIFDVRRALLLPLDGCAPRFASNPLGSRREFDWKWGQSRMFFYLFGRCRRHQRHQPPVIK